MNGSFEVREYVENGRSPYGEWFEGLDNVTADRVDKYMRRLEQGNFSAAKALQEGVFEGRAIASITGVKAGQSSSCSEAEASDGRRPT